MKKILSLISLTILMTACGENFEGTFVSQDAEIPVNNCNSVSGTFEMEVAATLSGNDIQFKINRLKGVDTKSSNLQAIRWTGIPYTASVAGDDRSFNADFRGFNNLPPELDRGYTLSGSLNTSRDQITNFLLRLDTYREDPETVADTPKCTIIFMAENLELIK